MRELLVILILLVGCSNAAGDQKPSYFVIFTNDGNFYKLSRQNKYVDWYSSLGFKLANLDFKSELLEQSRENPFLSITTLNGNLSIDRNKEILVQQTQSLKILQYFLQQEPYVDKLRNGSQIDQKLQYFEYQLYEYYIVNLYDGKTQGIEEFMKINLYMKKSIFAVLKVTKTFLKQLRLFHSDKQIKWRAISSQLDLIPAQMFLINPKITSQRNQSYENSLRYEFRRTGSKQIQMYDKKDKKGFNIGGKSPVMAVFQYLDDQNGFLSHKITPHDTKLEGASNNNEIFNTTLATTRQKQKENENTIPFIQSQQFESTSSRKDRKIHNDQIKLCVKIPKINKPEAQQDKIAFIDMEMKEGQMILSQPVNTKAEKIEPKILIELKPANNRPYLNISAFAITVVAGLIFLYKIITKSVSSRPSNLDNNTDKRLEETKKKLRKFEEIKKMYEVYWDKMVYKSHIISHERIDGEARQQSCDYFVFQGKFLNQSTFVYALPRKGVDIISIEHQLNLLLNCSHKSLCKLYYYTTNSQFLLIFTEKFTILSLQDHSSYFNIPIPAKNQKLAITEIVDTVKYLYSRIQIASIPFESICLEKIKQISENQSDLKLNFKINPVPCLLKEVTFNVSHKKVLIQSKRNLQDLRNSMVDLFSLILNSGQQINKTKMRQSRESQDYNQESYLNLLDFILNDPEVTDQSLIMAKSEENSQIRQSNRDALFKGILEHPFLWNSKRKMLFLSDFSNYIEIYIDQTNVKVLQTHAKDYKIIKRPWIKQFHPLFVKEVNNYRKYDFESIRDLIRVLRNKVNHFHQIPKEVRSVIGKSPEGFIQYFLGLFPKLLQFAYIYTKKQKWQLHMK